MVILVFEPFRCLRWAAFIVDAFFLIEEYFYKNGLYRLCLVTENFEGKREGKKIERKS